MSIQLRWGLRGTADSQKVYRDTSPLDRTSLPAALATLGATDVSYLDETATAFETTYYYIVETIEGADSVFSEQRSITTAADVVVGGDGYNVNDGAGGFEAYNVNDGAGGFESYEVGGGGGAPLTPAIELIWAADTNGDLWEFDAANSNATLDGDAMTTVTGIVNGHTFTGTDTNLSIDADGLESGDCDGSGDYFDFTPASPMSQPSTVVMVLDDTDITTHIIMTGADAGTRWQLSNGSGGSWQMVGGASSYNTNILEGAGKRVLVMEFNGASSRIWANGILQEEGTVGTVVTTAFRLGALYDNTFAGNLKIHGFGVVNRIITADERETVLQWGEGLLGNARPVGLPSSVVFALRPEDMTFAGSVLTGLKPAWGPEDDLQLVGAPAEGPNGGYMMTEATGNANHVRVNADWLASGLSTGVHMAVVYKKNGTADTIATLLGTTSSGDYIGVAQSGSGTTTVNNGATTCAEFRIKEASIDPLATTRGALWTATLGDTVTKSVAFKDISSTSVFDLYPGFYRTATPTLHAEAEILGIYLFTDWSQVDAVNTYAEGLVP